MTHKFTIEDAAFDGELGDALDDDPYGLGWPAAGNLKNAVIELKRSVGETGKASISVAAAAGHTAVEITTG